MKKPGTLFTFFLFCLIPFLSRSQELFIRQEPASNVPGGMWGFRFSTEEYREGTQVRTEDMLRIMHAFTPRLEVYVTPIISNHHLPQLPTELTSIDPGVSILHSHNKKLGYPRPYLFSGVDVYAKYLLLKHDGVRSHIRASVIGEASSCLQAHDEAEPNLDGDNEGVGAGAVVTQLMNKFAWSVTGERIFPVEYTQSLNNVVLKYPNAWEYIASFGYRILPIHYKNYKQLNVNAYLEFEGKQFGNAVISKDGVVTALYGLPQYNIAPASYLLANAYLEIHPGLQFIIDSNTRIDLSLGFPLISKSYRYTYPTHLIQIQHYFFSK